MRDPAYTGRRVLVAEDEYLLAYDLQQDLEDAGLAVVGPFATLRELLEAIKSDEDFDAAILDVNLAGEKVYAAAEALRRRGVPFLFATGYEASSVPKEFQDISCLSKPFELSRALNILGL
jgi:CheY-like chemotaxis protein